MAYSIPLKIINAKKEDYDKFVDMNPQASIFQTSDMAEVYNRTKGYKPSMVVAINEETDEILASVLAVNITEKKGFLQSFTNHSTIRGNPVLKSGKEGTEAAIALMSNFNKEFGLDSLYTRVYLTHKTPELENVFARSHYKFESWLNFLINLQKPKDLILASMKVDKRRAIRKAEKNGLIVQDIIDKNELQDFYTLLTGTYNEARLPLKDISLFEAIFDVLVKKGMARFIMAKKGNDYIAGRLVLTYKGSIYDWYACASKEHLSLYPNEFLIWDILKWGSENGFHTFDFGGAGTPDEKYGVRDFKERFGGRLVDYGRFTKIHHPQLYKVSKNLLDIYRKIRM
jgi:lipid II:glycine glycyltransferase (peptidoglycan interpeptide bridge formation enzyme)